MSIEIDFGVCALADYDEDNHAQIQTDSPGIDGNEGTQPAESLTLGGYHVRPLDPDKGPNGEVGLGAPCLVITMGDRRYALPLTDPRDTIDGKVPKLRKGGAMVAGGAGDYRSFFNIDGLDPAGAKQPGSVMISASYSKAGAKKSLGISLNVRDSGAEDITITHGDGARITIDKDGTTIVAPSGKHYVQISNRGNVLAGATKAQGSLTVGEQTAASEVALALPLIEILSQLIAVVSPIVGVTGAGAAAAPLAAKLATIKANHLKTT